MEQGLRPLKYSTTSKDGEVSKLIAEKFEKHQEKIRKEKSGVEYDTHVQRIKADMLKQNEKMYKMKGEPPTPCVQEKIKECEKFLNSDKRVEPDFKIINRIFKKNKTVSTVVEKGNFVPEVSEFAKYFADKTIPFKYKHQFSRVEEPLKKADNTFSSSEIFQHFMSGNMIRIAVDNDQIIHCYSSTEDRKITVFLNFKCKRENPIGMDTPSFIVIEGVRTDLTEKQVKYMDNVFKKIYREYLTDKVNGDADFKSVFEKHSRGYFEKALNFVLTRIFNQEPEKHYRWIQFI